jgi:S-adenosylmethionine synthetase
MKRQLFINVVPSTDNQPFEIVERKGIGHPDSLADGVAEAVSIEYSQFCLKEFGAILHHHFDKTVIMGGQGKIDFGIGELLNPYRLIINGRVSSLFGDKKIPYQEIQEKAAKEYLKKALPHLNVDKDIKIKSFSTSYSKSPVWYRPRNLDDLPEFKTPFVNDSSAIVSFWPLSKLEKLVLEIEKYFYEEEKPKFNYTGQDIKILAIRNYREVNITVAVPFISSYTPNRSFYLEKLEIIHFDLQKLAQTILEENYTINITLNAQDFDLLEISKERTGCYLSAIGSALDYGEEGVVGRGNRARGVRSCLRPNSTDAIHGKNPSFHVGKVYTYFADQISKAIAEEMKCECTVILATQNKRPTDSPQKIIINTSEKRNEKEIKEIIERELSKKDWVERIVEDKYFLPLPGRYYGQKD